MVLRVRSYSLALEAQIDGVTKPASLHLTYLGEWSTPYWTPKGDLGPIRRVGFTGSTRINRHDFKASWQGPLERGSLVVL